MFKLLPLAYLLLLQAPSSIPTAFSCVSYIDGRLVANRCEKTFDNPAAAQHRVIVDASILALGIEYRCKGASTVQVRLERYSITLDLHELQGGLWHSRGVGTVEWDANNVVHLSEFPQLSGGCTSEKGFSLKLPLRPPAEIRHWDHPLPSHGRSG